jgi:uncharacterized SAM-binding protein YcdF (DUF218 family)
MPKKMAGEACLAHPPNQQCVLSAIWNDMADFYFIASKVAWFFLEPLHILSGLVLLLILGIWLKCRWVRGLSVLTLITLLAIGALPIWNALLYDLERQYPPTQPPKAIEGIVVLGGALGSGFITEAHGQVALNSAAERMTTAVNLMRQYPEVPVIFSGFSGSFVRASLSESDLALRFFQEMTGSTERIILENQSRNTWENALYSKDLMGFAQQGQWLLVTSAFHMPRAMEIFQDQGLAVTPYPTDFRSRIPNDEFRWSLDDGADQLSLLMHEWIGLTVYRTTQAPR